MEKPRDMSYSSHQGKYLGSYRASNIERVNSVYATVIFIEIKEDRILDGVARGSRSETNLERLPDERALRAPFLVKIRL